MRRRRFLHSAMGAVALPPAAQDRDIEIYARFVRDLGKPGIPVATYDFHPANAYPTNMVAHRGYFAREFDLNDFHTKVEETRK